MSTPERPVLPDHPTKQQLDELDALMARMLALPVNQPETLVPAARPIVAALPSGETGEPLSTSATSAIRSPS